MNAHEKAEVTVRTDGNPPQLLIIGEEIDVIGEERYYVVSGWVNLAESDDGAEVMLALGEPICMFGSCDEARMYIRGKKTKDHKYK